MPEEYFDVVSLFWTDEVILNGRKAGGQLIKLSLTSEQRYKLEVLQTKHDDELQKLLKGFVYSE